VPKLLKRILIGAAGLYLLAGGMIDLYQLIFVGDFSFSWKGRSNAYFWPGDWAGILLVLTIQLGGGAFCLWESLWPRPDRPD
jgi:hypothetical protein